MKPARNSHGRATLVALLLLVNAPVAAALVEAGKFFLANRNTGAIVSSGEHRAYILHVPASYDARRPVPLVISLHGAALWGAAQREISEWDRVADREGFIVAYPSGVSTVGPRVWRVAERAAGLERDVRFIADLIDTLSRAYGIDSTRIYANGLSNGGGMSFVLSCTLGQRIAAVGLVGAALTIHESWCPDTSPVPVIAFHGTHDTAAPYAGGRTWVSTRNFPNVPEWMAKWARRNHCAGARDSLVAADVVRRAYGECARGADVVFYTITDGGHTWPGGGDLPKWAVGTTTRSIDASSEMWAFFRAHPLRR